MKPFNLMIYLDGSSAARRMVAYLAPLARQAHVKTTFLVDEAHQDEAEMYFFNAEQLLQSDQAPTRTIRGATPERAIVLETRASQPDLVAFGPLRKEGWRRWLGQSAIGSLARRLTCSMLLMQGRPNELRRALVCAAGGPATLHDAQMTASIIGPLGGQVTILHIVSQLSLTYKPEERDPERLADLVMEKQGEVARNIAAAKTILTDRGITTTVRIRAGMVLEEIQEELKTGGYDLLVIGAHRARTPLDRVLLEDVSAEILFNSPIPVLLVQNTSDF